MLQFSSSQFVSFIKIRLNFLSYVIGVKLKILVPFHCEAFSRQARHYYIQSHQNSMQLCILGNYNVILTFRIRCKTRKRHEQKGFFSSNITIFIYRIMNQMNIPSQGNVYVLYKKINTCNLLLPQKIYITLHWIKATHI